MLIKPKEKLTSTALLSLVSESGSKFKAFVAALQAKFNKFSRITIGVNLRYQAPVVIFGVILALKSIKVFEDSYDRMFFLQLLKIKHQQINGSSHKMDRAFEKLYDIVSHVLNNVNQLSKFNNDVQSQQYVYALLNNIAGNKKVKEYSYEMQITYTPQQMNKIGEYFDQKVKLIDYDDTKELSSKIEPTFDETYIVKAKGVYFVVTKSRSITLINEGTIGYEQIASIFTLDNEQSTISLKSNLPSLISSQLFPQQVECTICGKGCSQFDALSWNYTYYCYDCIIKPKVNTSAIPQSVIQKYLGLKKFDFNTYTIICPECKGETTINRYNPAAKPASFTCKVCEKKICVQHQQYIGDCFCYCFNCNKPTLTIESMLSKYCMSCRTRLCHLCNAKTKKECNCLCLKCYNVNLVDHQCKDRCHQCLCVLPSMKLCECGRSICNGCYYANFQKMEISNGKEPMCRLTNA